MADVAKDAATKPEAMKAAKMKDKMTLEEYRAFAKMYGLDIGG